MGPSPRDLELCQDAARSEGKAHPRPEVGHVLIRPGLAKERSGDEVVVDSAIVTWRPASADTIRAGWLPT